MNTLFQFHIYIFSVCNVAKRFASFSYYDLPNFDSVNIGDCSKSNIIKIDGVYYIYSGEQIGTTSNKEMQKSKILFKSGRKVIAEIAA